MGQVTAAAPLADSILTAPDPRVEAAYLRRLLESQPAPLLRVGADDLILAVNDAGLALLWADRREMVLDRSMTGWIPGEQHDAWRRFASRVVGGSPSSIQCDLAGALGERRAVVAHGVPIEDALDGVRSLLLIVQDRSLVRTLEDAFVDKESPREPEAAGRHGSADPELTRLSAECERLASTVADLTAERQRLLAGQEVDQIQVERALAAAVASRARLAEQLSQQFQEIERLTGHARRMVPLAAAGRVALDVAAGLRDVMAAVDARSASLVEACGAHSRFSQQVAELRRDILNVSTLIARIVQTHEEASSLAEQEADAGEPGSGTAHA